MADVTDAEDGEIERLLHEHGPFEKPPQLKESDRIGDWNVLAFLGRGGSAEVYRAENLVTGISGAAKVLYRSDDKARARFKREAQLLSELSGASFPKFYGAGEDSGHLYVAEELLEPAEIPRRDTAVARYVTDVACAVAELHKRGFVHRDIKPSNVMVRSATGEYVLIDLGLAKEDGDTPRGITDTLSVVDGRARGVGTPGYSAPEQFAGGRIGEEADIHALGVLANVCFDGKPPRAWVPIIRRSTSSIPEQRYATVAEFTCAVCRRHAARWWICGIALGLAVGVFCTFMTSTKKDASRPTADTSHPTQSHVAFESLKTEDALPKAAAKRQIAERKEPVVKKDASVNRPIKAAKKDDSDDGLLGAVYDAMYGGDNGRYATITNGSIVVGSIFELGETKAGSSTFEKGMLITHIELNGRDVTIPGETRLEGKRRIEIVGPGRLTASITGPREVRMELSRQATLINLTETPYPESSMKFILKGACYLNFKNLDSPEDGDIDGIWFDTFSENGTPSFRYRGPDSYEEVRKADKKAALEIMRQGLPPVY